MDRLNDIFNILGAKKNNMAEKIGVSRVALNDWCRWGVPEKRKEQVADALGLHKSYLDIPDSLNSSEILELYELRIKNETGMNVEIKEV